MKSYFLGTIKAKNTHNVTAIQYLIELFPCHSPRKKAQNATFHSIWVESARKVALLAHTFPSHTISLFSLDSFIGCFCCSLNSILRIRNVKSVPRSVAEYQKCDAASECECGASEPLHNGNEWARLEYRWCSLVLHRLLIITIVCVSFFGIFLPVFSRVYNRAHFYLLFCETFSQYFCLFISL